MGFFTLLKVASMPIVQMLIISMVGAFMATDYLNLLPPDARSYMNKIVYVAFTPSLVFGSLASTVNFQDIISWWFMPVNIGLTFVFGASLGWIVVKLLRPQPYIANLILAICSAGNLGNILLILIPAICKQKGSPFGDANACSTLGLSYVSYSMAVGAFYVWTYAFHLIRSAAVKYRAALVEDIPSKDLEGDDGIHKSLLVQPIEVKHSSRKLGQVLGILHQLVEELMSPPVVAAIFGFIFGAVAWLGDILIGENAPLRVIYDSISLLGDGTIPCITLILGGNLTQGLRKAKLNPMLIVAVIVVKYILLPMIGIGVVLGAARLGFLPSDPLFRFVLMIQFTLPPAMNIGTMTQLFDVAQEECSVLFLWTYLAAAIALTAWSSLFMWILT
ncbi:protein PIN-LIKES 7-like [Salvia hispanica]|uniref:protein PIN-LIKES 7-like n=1 Tax=Salvia hispanica TaxID=49212 RepID=UPI0020095299|nr:protein PIN-LIKES 7-like [Salvia hispanica]